MHYPLDDLPISVRAYRCLKPLEERQQDPLSWSDEQLLAIRGFGKRCLADVREAMADYRAELARKMFIPVEYRERVEYYPDGVTGISMVTYRLLAQGSLVTGYQTCAMGDVPHYQPPLREALFQGMYAERIAAYATTQTAHTA